MEDASKGHRGIASKNCSSSPGNGDSEVADIINKINYLHFKEGTVTAIFKHLRYNNTIQLKARLLPCTDNNLQCFWIEDPEKIPDLESYEFISLVLDDGLSLISVTCNVVDINSMGISLFLTGVGYITGKRSKKRYACADVSCNVVQNSVSLKGVLVDINTSSFRVNVEPFSSQSAAWLDQKRHVHVTFAKGDALIYSGECEVLRQSVEHNRITLVIRPTCLQSPRFKSKVYRSSRYRLTPSPNIFFTHPLTGRMLNFEVYEMSGAGCSVEESLENSVMFPGLVIQDMYLTIANNWEIKCKGQVVHQSSEDDNVSGHKKIVCGIAFTDIELQDQVRITNLLQSVDGKQAFVCNKVDPEALWEFFFDVGFIYAKKYENMYLQKKEFRETYRKLYVNTPSLARHFIYQDKGEILGHIAMLRTHENTWLFHHHAARKSQSRKAGLVVLKQISQYANDFYLLDSTHMHYVVAFYRPDNKFPHKIFGGFAEYIKRPSGSSVDQFGYLHVLKGSESLNPDKLAEIGAAITEASYTDLFELQNFYEHKWGGLMLKALDLEPDMLHAHDLTDEYCREGFKRERKIISLKIGKSVKAVFDVSITDIGLNLSNATNCIRVFVIDFDLDIKILNACIMEVANRFKEEEVTVMIFPIEYAQLNEIPLEKVYNFWVLNLPDAIEDFIKYENKYISHAG